jgi:hypothetical protein
MTFARHQSFSNSTDTSSPARNLVFGKHAAADFRTVLFLRAMLKQKADHDKIGTLFFQHLFLSAVLYVKGGNTEE